MIFLALLGFFWPCVILYGWKVGWMRYVYDDYRAIAIKYREISIEHRDISMIMSVMVASLRRHSPPLPTYRYSAVSRAPTGYSAPQTTVYRYSGLQTTDTPVSLGIHTGILEAVQLTPVC